MLTDFRVPVDFVDHFKTKLLRRRLGPGTTDYLLRLWGYATQRRTSGFLGGLTAETLAVICEWEGDAETFIGALIECGFVDATDAGWTLHDWAEHQPWVVGAEARAEASRKAARVKHGRTQADSGSDAGRMRPAQKRTAESCAPDAPSPNPHLTDPSPYPNPTPSPSPVGDRAAARVPAPPTEGQRQLLEADVEAPAGPSDGSPSRRPRSGGHLLNLKLGPARGEPETWAFTSQDLATMLPAAEYFGVAARELPHKILVNLGKRYPDAQDRWLAMPPETVAAWCAEVAKKTQESKGRNSPADPGLVNYAAVIVGDRIEARIDILEKPAVPSNIVQVRPGAATGGERRMSTQERNMAVLRQAAAEA